MKTLLLAEWGAPFYPRLRQRHPGETLVECYSVPDILREVPEAEAIFGYLTKEQFVAARKLRWVQTLDAGMEGLFNRIPEIAETGITVTNARGAGAPQIGEHALALILAFARGLPEFARLQRQRRWDQDYGLSTVQMAWGKTAGIIGFGSQAERSAGAAKPSA